MEVRGGKSPAAMRAASRSVRAMPLLFGPTRHKTGALKAQTDVFHPHVAASIFYQITPRPRTLATRTDSSPAGRGLCDAGSSAVPEVMGGACSAALDNRAGVLSGCTASRVGEARASTTIQRAALSHGIKKPVTGQNHCGVCTP